MKVVHLSTFPVGGAGVAASRLMLAERVLGVDAEFMTAADFGVNVNTYGKSPAEIRYRLLRKVEHVLDARLKTTNPIFRSVGLCSFNLVNRINALSADIVHLHWINHGFLSIADIARIRKPLVWTLHDSWPVCGGEHHPNLREGDVRYREGYRRSNFPETSSGLDVDRLVWLWKRHCWKNLSCTFTAPSSWQAEIFNQGALSAGRSCAVIPNCVPTDRFAPQEGAEFRRRLDVAPSAYLIAFGAASLKDENKGMSRLMEAVRVAVRRHPDMALVCFGRCEGMDLRDLGIPVRMTGIVTDERELARLYSAADVFVCPSAVENLPNTVLEAESCGTPVVAFDVGGLPDAVLHRQTGYLARPYDVEDLANGLSFCRDNRTTARCRSLIERRFSPAVVGRQFRRLYEGLLS